MEPLSIDDLDAVAALETAIFPEDPWSRGMVSEELRSRARHYVGLRAGGGDLIAYAGVALGPDAEIMTIGVLPDWRGRGLGTLLLRDLITAAREAGAERIFLEVRASNESAQRLYEREGFTRIGQIRGYFRHPTEDAVTMRALLTEVPSVLR
ncbi:MAG: ribosomal protein S18-alanine N-acetyltransferase [Actinomycetaceae bacterium]|nr:ribosomal protein S18-alanine N-acetyltransferase [Actinomycetaceae bacterium]